MQYTKSPGSPYLNIRPIAAHYSPLNQPQVFTFQGKLYKTYNGTLKEKNTYLKKNVMFHMLFVICPQRQS